MHSQHDFEGDQLTILYALHSAQMDLREDQLARIFAELHLMDFFDLKEGLYALMGDEQIEEILTIQGPLYHLTDRGESIIRELASRVRLSAREDLDRYMQSNKARLEEESTYLTGYTRMGDGQYRVQARIVYNNTPVFQISLLLETKEEAATFIEEWPRKGEELYQHVLMELTV